MMTGARRITAVRLLAVAATVAVGCSTDVSPDQPSPPAPLSPALTARPAPPASTPPAAPERVTAEGGLAKLAPDGGAKLTPDAASEPPEAGVREFRLRNGSMAKVSPGGQVLIIDAYGNVNAESYCGPGGYDAAVAYMTKLQTALRTGDETVADLVHYPLRLNKAGGYREVANKTELIANFSKIFTSSTKRGILSADPGEVFCNDDGDMWGDGIIWVGEYDEGLALDVINQ